MGFLDPPALRPTSAAKLFAPVGALPVRRSNKGARLGDSLTANGTTQISVAGTIAAVVAGATSITITITNSSPLPLAGHPAAGDIFIIDAGLATEERVVLGAVTGTARTFTAAVPALSFAHTSSAPIRGLQHRFIARSVPMWTTILSNGRIRIGGIFAHGGYIAAQIQAVYLPQLLAQAELRGFAEVNIVRNDLYTDAALMTYMQIVDTLIATGILPVLTSAPPATALGFTLPPTWSLKLAREANKRGVPFVDIYSMLVNDGSSAGSPERGVRRSTSTTPTRRNSARKRGRKR